MPSAPRYPTNPTTIHAKITSLNAYVVLVDGAAATSPSTAPPAVLLENILVTSTHVGARSLYLEVAEYVGAAWVPVLLGAINIPAGAGYGVVAPVDALATLQTEYSPDGTIHGKVWDNHIRLRGYAIMTFGWAINVLVIKSDLEE